MRNFIDIIEASQLHPRPYGGGEFAVHHNPSIEEFMKLLQDANGVVRALIDEDGELWCWDGDHALHSDVDALEATFDAMGFIIFYDHIDAQDCDVRSLRASLAKNTSMKTLKVNRLRMTKNR